MGKRAKKAAQKIIKEAIEHTPKPIKEKVKDFVVDKGKEMVVEHVQDKANRFTEKLENGQEKFADKVHDQAIEAKEKTQDVLLNAREKLGKVAEAGKGLQEKVSSSHKHDHKRKVKGANHIKGVSNIKTSKDIKGATRIKSYEKIKS
ncbi:gas vesicle protein GvpQ [Neobacillus vireti]|uniref:gas vesicle protein GvpQ n=1 Tax=Neobacillus vireti TaxID=220686 RepID=UPI002FFEA47C